jgi:hypothetical protein
MHTYFSSSNGPIPPPTAFQWGYTNERDHPGDLAWTGLIWLRIGTRGGPLVKTVMNLRVAYNMENFLTNSTTTSFWRRTVPHGFESHLMSSNKFFQRYAVFKKTNDVQ